MNTHSRISDVAVATLSSISNWKKDVAIATG